MYKVINYTFGLFADISEEVWLNRIHDENPDYEIFSVNSGYSWSPGGGTSWRTAYLKLKNR